MAASIDERRRERLEQLRRRRADRPTRHTSPRRAYEQLRASIRAGAVGEEERLGEMVLTESLGASRSSVRAALAMLAAEGIIVRRRRTGTRVDRRIVEIPIDDPVPRSCHGEQVELIVLTEALVELAGPVRARLALSDAPVLMTEMLAQIDGRPIYLRTSYVPLDGRSAGTSGQPATGGPANETVSSEKTFLALSGRAIGRGEAAVEAVPAQGEVARLLDLPPGRAVLLRELVTRDDTNVVREISHTHFRGDRVALASSG